MTINNSCSQNYVLYSFLICPLWNNFYFGSRFISIDIDLIFYSVLFVVMVVFRHVYIFIMSLFVLHASRLFLVGNDPYVLIVSAGLVFVPLVHTLPVDLAKYARYVRHSFS